MYEYVTVDMYATLFTFVGRNLCNSSMCGKKCVTLWIGQAITRQYGTMSFVYMVQFWSIYIVQVGGGDIDNVVLIDEST